MILDNDVPLCDYYAADILTATAQKTLNKSVYQKLQTAVRRNSVLSDKTRERKLSKLPIREKTLGIGALRRMTTKSLRAAAFMN